MLDVLGGTSHISAALLPLRAEVSFHFSVSPNAYLTGDHGHLI
jgi:hypothetical protein